MYLLCSSLLIKVGPVALSILQGVLNFQYGDFIPIHSYWEELTVLDSRWMSYGLQGEIQAAFFHQAYYQAGRVSLFLCMSSGHWQLQRRQDREINSLFLLCKNEQTGTKHRDSTALHFFSLSCVIVTSLGKTIRKGKFRVIFSFSCKLCYEPCRDCLFTTVFISHQWTFPTHFCFTLFNPICTYGKIARGRELPSSFSENMKKKESFHSLFLTCFMISFISLQIWYYEKK